VVQGSPLPAAAETSVRQLIANGKSKTALDNAKDLHKACNSAASEALLLDAYAARIESLIRHNLATEAIALIQLVSERYPAARERFNGLGAAAAARMGALDELVAPLNDPGLSPQRLAAIEEAIRNEVVDLAALARCTALPPEHPLRAAAQALDRAFCAVTGSPPAEEVTALAEVSHRHPLAPWKSLARAIACFYRSEDESCRQHLDAIKTGTVPSRLAPALRALAGAPGSAALTPASAALVSQVNGNWAALGSALGSLDRALEGGEDRAVLRAIRLALQECRRYAPDRLERLKQHITARCIVRDMEPEPVIAALGGTAIEDAYFLRLHARALELSRDAEDLAIAAGMWDEFLRAAVQEGWFPPDGVEAAAVYLHVVEILRRVPGEMLRQFEKTALSKPKGGDAYFLSPDELYQRACAADPHSEAFSQWMNWAAGQSPSRAEQVARAWHKVRPEDLDPILYLMDQAAKRRSYDKALKHLASAERVNGVHPAVRRARLRLLAASAMRHIEKRKPRLAEKELAEMAALPQSQQGDRPAFLASLRCALASLDGDRVRAGAERDEIERRLASGAAADLLISSVAAACGRGGIEDLRRPEKLPAPERAALPASLVRVCTIAGDMGMGRLPLPSNYVLEAARQFKGVSDSLDTNQLRTLAEMALSVQHPDLAYAASSAGLARGGATEARFLFLRARSLPEDQFRRRAVLTAAAAEIARSHRDLDLVEAALAFLRGPLECEDLDLTAAGAAEMLRREKAQPKKAGRKSRGPSYYDVPLPERCDCPDCRRARGETVDDFDDDEDDDLEDIFEAPPPRDIPPEVARTLFNEATKAARNGESIRQMLNRLMGPPPRDERGKRGGRK
jgi:hypothetical protein